MIPDNEYYYNHGILEENCIYVLYIEWLFLSLVSNSGCMGAAGQARLAEIEGT